MRNLDKFNEVYTKIIMEMNQASVEKFDDDDDNFEGTFNGSFKGFVNSLLDKNKKLFEDVVKEIIREVDKNATMDPNETDFQEKDIKSSLEFTKFLKSVLEDESSYSTLINELKKYIKAFWPDREDYFDDIKMFLWSVLSSYAEEKFNVTTLAADF